MFHSPVGEVLSGNAACGCCHHCQGVLEAVPAELEGVFGPVSGLVLWFVWAESLFMKQRLQAARNLVSCIILRTQCAMEGGGDSVTC